MRKIVSALALGLALSLTAGWAAAGPQDPLIELRSWRWSRSGSGHFVQADGEIANVALWPLDHVEAVVTWYAKGGALITSASALIEYDPLMPGQRSPFKVLGKWNPAMADARIDFRTFSGRPLRWVQRRAAGK